MAKGSNIVHRYFKKKFKDGTILVKVNPLSYTGVEMTLCADGKGETRELTFDEAIWEDLKMDGFEEASALEFNLYYSGLV